MEEGRRGREGGGREGREGWKREGGGRDGRGRGEGEMGGLVVACVHPWCWPSFMRVRGPWPSTGGHVVIRGHSMFVGGSWSSVGARCSWVGCRGRQWSVVRGRLTLVGGWLLSSIGVSAVWCHVCGQSRSSVVRLWQSSGRVLVRGVVVVYGARRSRIGRGHPWARSS